MSDEEIYHDEITIRLELAIQHGLLDLDNAHQLELRDFIVLRCRNHIDWQFDVEEVQDVRVYQTRSSAQSHVCDDPN